MSAMAIRNKGLTDSGDPAAADVPEADSGSPDSFTEPLRAAASPGDPASPLWASAPDTIAGSPATQFPGGEPGTFAARILPEPADPPPIDARAGTPPVDPPSGNDGRPSSELAGTDSLSLFKAGLDQFMLGGSNAGALPGLPAGDLSNGASAAAGVAQLVSAMANYAAGNTAFNATPFARTPDDAGLQAVIAGAGHS